MDVTETPFSWLYPLPVNRTEKKCRTPQEVNQVTDRLTGYAPECLTRPERPHVSYGDFFCRAPRQESQPSSDHLQDIRRPGGGDPDPADAGTRYLDKLVDEPARGNAMEQIRGSDVRLPDSPQKSPLLCAHKPGCTEPGTFLWSRI